MVAKPAVTPVTIPVVEPTVATAVLLLLQVPPVVASVSVLEEPAQTVSIPLMGLTANEAIEQRHANNVGVINLIIGYHF